MNHNIKPPPLYCLIKDHKDIISGQTIPSRPVVSATESQTGPLGNILTTILNSTADVYSAKQGSECDSTEDMISSMNQANKEIRDDSIENVVLVSTDVEKLYPSLEAEESSQLANQMIVESGINFIGMNHREAALYLVLTLTKAERGRFEEEMPGILPTRKNKGGQHPGITTKEVLDRAMDDHENVNSLFKEGSQEPNGDQKRIILAKCVEVALVTCMKNHAYTFHQQSYLQEQGGAIGERFTQALARLVMLK